MDQRKRIDKILDVVEKKIQNEVATLLGSDFSVIGGDRGLFSKEEVFSRLQGKQVLAHLDVAGDHVGKGAILVAIKDAIRLGGTLIMLPDLELQEVVGREEYREELEDSYGEIANIIAGSVTKAFEEMYPGACRFIRKEQEVVIPTKVDAESDAPIVSQRYYQSLFSMLLDGKQMGDLVLLMPAAPFDLDDAVPPKAEADETAVAKESPAPAPTAAPGSEAPASAAVPRPAEKPKVDFDKQKKRIDKLLAECEKRLAGEIGALLSAEVGLEKVDNRLLDKEKFFSEVASGKQIIADMNVAGEGQGACYFSIGIKDAIHLGGILIMLPPTELISVIGEEDFSDDTQDAYGEVANIVSGVYTAVFEEQYTEKLRFVKKGIRQVVPAKVEADSPEPFADGAYYCQTMQLIITGKPSGEVHMLFPAGLLQLEREIPAPVVEKKAEPAPSPAPDEKKAEAPPAPLAAGPAPTGRAPSADKGAAEKQKRLVDKLLAACRDQVAAEVTALLGTEVTLGDQHNQVISKESFFFEEVSGKQVISHFEVAGDAEGKSFLVVGLRDAIRVGGVLIMLPSQELESVIADEVFGEDTADAYGEIANIIAGVYTAVFEEQYSKRIRFIKKEVEQVVPMKVDIASDSPFPDGSYYHSSCTLGIGDQTYGKIGLVFPLDILGLEGLLAADEEPVTKAAGDAEPVAAPLAQHGSPDILLVGDDDTEAIKIAGVLEARGYVVKRLSFKDNVHNYLPGEIKAVFLVMREVNEQAFGAAIKISAACRLPLIAAGPAWTRSKVIKAVRYGIRDILLTPASATDVEESVVNNLLKLAA